MFGLHAQAGQSDLAFADAVANGLPVKAAYALESLLKLIGRGAFYCIASESALRRAKNGSNRLTREPSRRLYVLARVIDQAARTFCGDEQAVARFLNRPNPVLEGRTPFDVARASSLGADLVVEVLRKAHAGVAV